MKISEIIKDKYKLRIPPTVYYDLLADVQEAEEPKKGHWEYGYAFPDGQYCRCSECEELIKCTYPMHYCPNCGAKMQSEAE